MSNVSQDGWVVLAAPQSGIRSGRIPSPRQVVLRMLAAAALVSLLIGVMGFYVATRLAEHDTLSEGIRITDILASEIAPRVTTGLAQGNQDAIRDLDLGVLPAMNHYGVIRVKLFSDTGKVLYSDEHRLIGQEFPLGRLQSLASSGGPVETIISNPTGDEDAYERSVARVIEVRQGLVGASGRALLEVYLDYNIVGERAREMWRAFLVLLVGSLALLTAMVIPVAFQLLRRIGEGTRQREALLRNAVEASDLERRRIAASLHDGPVQELVGNTLALSTAAARLAGAGQADAAATVDGAAQAVRGTIGSLRTLLVDLYPAPLDEQGLSVAVDDLLASLRSRGLVTTAAVDDEGLSAVDRRLAFRVTQECLRNVAKHARATAVGVRLTQEPGSWQLTVSDNGHGFDVSQTMLTPTKGHYGVRILSDIAAEAGATLRVASGPDGTCWELRKDHA